MLKSSGLHQQEIAEIVVERFQRYLGTAGPLPLSSRLLDDLGIDSIAFVTILLDLAEQLGLNLHTAQVSLSSIETLDDALSLVRSLYTG